jgi:hypothetical protein
MAILHIAKPTTTPNVTIGPKGDLVVSPVLPALSVALGGVQLYNNVTGEITSIPTPRLKDWKPEEVARINAELLELQSAA